MRWLLVTPVVRQPALSLASALVLLWVDLLGPGSSFARLQRLQILFLALVSVMTAGLLTTVVLLEGSLTLTVTASDVIRSLEVVHAQLGQQHSAIQH